MLARRILVLKYEHARGYVCAKGISFLLSCLIKMKKLIWFFPVILFILAGCSGNKPKDNTILRRNDSAVMHQDYDTIISEREHADEDPRYRHSETYRYVQEVWHRHIAERTVGMDHTDQLLYEYEIAVHSVNQFGRYAIGHPDKMRNQRMQHLMKLRGDEALRLHDQLLGMKLSTEQQKKFNALNLQSN